MSPHFGPGQISILESLRLMSGRGAPASELCGDLRLEAALATLHRLSRRGLVEYNDDGEVRTYTTKWRLTAAGKQAANTLYKERYDD